jgi:hypothetical protein
MRGAQIKVPVTEAPAGFHQHGPGHVIANTVRYETPRLLEGADGRLGRHAIYTGVSSCWLKAGGAEPALQVSDGLAGSARDQWEVPKNSESS